MIKIAFKEIQHQQYANGFFFVCKVLRSRNRFTCIFNLFMPLKLKTLHTISPTTWHNSDVSLPGFGTWRNVGVRDRGGLPPTSGKKALQKRCFGDIKMTCARGARPSTQFEACIYEQEPLIRACVSSLVTVRDGPRRRSLMIITKSDGAATGRVSGDLTLEKKH